jgi:hypothetical protein
VSDDGKSENIPVVDSACVGGESGFKYCTAASSGEDGHGYGEAVKGEIVTDTCTCWRTGPSPSSENSSGAGDDGAIYGGVMFSYAYGPVEHERRPHTGGLGRPTKDSEDDEERRAKAKAKARA